MATISTRPVAAAAISALFFIDRSKMPASVTVPPARRPLVPSSSSR